MYGGYIVMDQRKTKAFFEGRDIHAYNIFGYDRVIDVDEVQSLLILVKPGEEPVSVDIR